MLDGEENQERSIICIEGPFRSIKHLPISVHSSLRSSVILFDLTRVVEELIFNSLDAGASKVHISIGICACYVKVDDDGCGISRDGLVLLGEKYATSKFQYLGEVDTGFESLGYRGEALGSLSDFSLVEVVTKARGRPNGYRKIIKGCKCLFLGIDDQIKNVGTTVIVRDLFYNQPVRRKCLQSSTKKVLHSVKKCVLRIALVYPEVSFRVIDVESEDELLYTLPSPTPLPLVTTGFGHEVSSTLHEVNFSDKVLRLLGYLSGPDDSFSTKAFQYVYINSRFVSKGPIHKLLNTLATSFQGSLPTLKDDPEFQNGKRHKIQSYPAFMLNLHCPQSIYNLSFEPSKTLVEFKDWPFVLAFIERVVKHLRRNTPFLQGESHGDEHDVIGKDEMCHEGTNIPPLHELFSGDPSEVSEVPKKKNKIKYHQDPPSYSPSIDCVATSFVDIEFFSCHKNHQGSSRESPTNTEDLKGAQRKNMCIHPTGSSFRKLTPYPWDISDSKCSRAVDPKSSIYRRMPEIILSPDGDQFLSGELVGPRNTRNTEEEDILSSTWRSKSLEVDSNFIQGLLDGDEFNHKTDARVRKTVCNSNFTSVATIPVKSTMFPDHLEFGIHFGELRDESKLVIGDGIDIIDESCSNQCLDYLARDPLMNGRACQLSSPIMKRCRTSAHLDELSSDIQNESFAQLGKHGSDFQSPNLKWCLGSPLSMGSDLWMSKDASHRYKTERKFSFQKCKSISYMHLSDGEAGGEFLKNVPDKGGYPTTSCTHIGFDNKSFQSPEESAHEFLSCRTQSHGTIDEKDPLNKLYDGTDWWSITDHHVIPQFHMPFPSRNKMINAKWMDEPKIQNCRLYPCPKRSRRSSSAPPFYKGKCKFSLINSHLNMTAEREREAQFFHSGAALWAANQESLAISSYKPIVTDGSKTPSRTCTENTYVTHHMNGMEKSQAQLEKSQFTFFTDAVKVSNIAECVSAELENSKISQSKWQNGDPQSTAGDKSHNLAEYATDILDISSGLLHLSGSSLVPESINKDFLENAKVLLQLDKKFIPVISGGTLAIIDQHAADERIRLEELRQKVLSGEGRKIAYLDSEQEMVLPELSFQLLQNYAEHIAHWGWICNIHARGSESFTKNLNLLNRRPSPVTLVAVPCILGINLSDKDLMDFLEQLAESDGSSTIPPAVVRILNLKACRGAIMFGDPLLPSECSLIVDELKRTSLCFQCAHGRPTTVPLVNLEALHKQLSKLCWSGSAAEQWHGLRQHRATLGRAKMRLKSDDEQKWMQA